MFFGGVCLRIGTGEISFDPRVLPRNFWVLDFGCPGSLFVFVFVGFTKTQIPMGIHVFSIETIEKT